MKAHLITVVMKGHSHLDHFIKALDSTTCTARSLGISALEPYTLQSYKDLTFFQFRMVAHANDALHQREH